MKTSGKTKTAKIQQAKTLSKKQAVTSPERWRRLSLARLGLLVVIVGLVLFLGVKSVVREVQFRSEKKQFAATEVSMQQVYNQMVAAAGKPVEEHTVKSCSHRAAKLKTGTLECGIKYDFFYPTANVDYARKLANVFLPILSYDSFDNQTPKPLLAGYNDNATTQTYAFNDMNNTACGFNYVSQTAVLHNELLNDDLNDDSFSMKTNSAYAAEFSFYCTSTPTKPIYKIVSLE